MPTREKASDGAATVIPPSLWQWFRRNWMCAGMMMPSRRAGVQDGRLQSGSKNGLGENGGRPRCHSKHATSCRSTVCSICSICTIHISRTIHTSRHSVTHSRIHAFTHSRIHAFTHSRFPRSGPISPCLLRGCAPSPLPARRATLHLSFPKDTLVFRDRGQI
jgi:hypothetical protein